LRKDYYTQTAQNIKAQIDLPAGFEKVDGDLTWEGSLVAGETQTIKATIKSTKTGSFMIDARAGFTTSISGVGGATTLYITVSENGATVSEHMPQVNPALTIPASSNPSDSYTTPVRTIPPPDTGQSYILIRRDHV
jgi:hypothetical protein